MIRQHDQLTIVVLPLGGAVVRSVEPGQPHCTAKAKRIAETYCVRCGGQIGVGRAYVEVSGALHSGGLYHRECVKEV